MRRVFRQRAWQSGTVGKDIVIPRLMNPYTVSFYLQESQELLWLKRSITKDGQ